MATSVSEAASMHAQQQDTPLFEAQALQVQIDTRLLLSDVNLSITRGRVCGLIGHNGSGKTTLLRVLARQLKAIKGTVTFEGKPLEAWDSRAFARKVAYLPQTLPNVDGMTVRELVALGRYPWHGAFGRYSRNDADKVAEAMELTDVAQFAKRYVDQLSGGERQRVWLAMLVAQDSECLLLDEPISALDIAHQLDVLGLVRRLSALRSLGVVVVLHDINIAARFCDELVALHSGRLLVRGSPVEICRPQVLHSIYGVSMDTLMHPRGGVPVCYPS